MFAREFVIPEKDRNAIVQMTTGQVRDLRVEGMTIYFQRKLDGALRPIERDFETVQRTLGLSRLESYRTHWAIKRGDFGLVRALIDRGQGPTEAGAPEAPRYAASFSLPARPNADDEAHRLEDAVDDVVGYLSTVFRLQDALPAGQEAWYRGHGCWNYRLTPSLLRKDGKTGAPFYPSGEFEMVQDVLSAHPGEFAGDAFTFDRLVRMQNFGLPTRLLDITANPLMALYFAAETDHRRPAADLAEGDQPTAVDVDGEVVILVCPKDGVKYYDSDTVSCIANLSMLRSDQRAGIDAAIKEVSGGVGAFNADPALRPLLDAIKREKSYFQNEVVPGDLRRILFVRGRRSNPRIEAQSGAFILFGLEAPEIEVLPGEITLHRIPVRNKARIRQELAALNITAQTVYPGLEKTAAAVARFYRSLD